MYKSKFLYKSYLVCYYLCDFLCDFLHITFVYKGTFPYQYVKQSYELGARCSSVVRAFTHGAMGRWIDPSWWNQ